MATLKAEVLKLNILEHPNADALEIAQVMGYQSIVRKGQFKTGDLAVYIPEQSVVPEWILRRLGLWDDEKGKGKLVGPDGNRVKAVKLRGVISQGLIFPLEHVYNPTVQQDDWRVILECGNEYWVDPNEDVTDLLGITKWEPPIPVSMAGEVCNLYGKTIKYDIENIKNYPEIAEALINLNVNVHITEKLHGTWCCIGIYPYDISDEILDKRIFVTSKGLSGKGLVFKDNEANANNLYMKALKNLYNKEGMARTLRNLPNGNEPIFLIGEIFGQGVQDLNYGLKEPQFRIFDIYEGVPGQGNYLTPPMVNIILNSFRIEVPTVPVLYEGKLNHGIIHEYTNGKDTLSNSHVREGIVIRTLDKEYRNDNIGRVILKSVSPDYLTRKNATEYN